MVEVGGWRQQSGQRHHTDWGLCVHGSVRGHKARNMQTLGKKCFHGASSVSEHCNIPVASNKVQILAGLPRPQRGGPSSLFQPPHPRLSLLNPLQFPAHTAHSRLRFFVHGFPPGGMPFLCQMPPHLEDGHLP